MIERACWILLALIHLSPFAALLFPSLISNLYGVAADGPSFSLLHHRAALFGVVFIACIWASFDFDVRKLVFVVTALSMLSFLGIYLVYGQPPSLRMIAIADIVGLPALVYVGWKAFSV